MKAAKRIRDYLHVLKRDQPNRSRISVLPGAEPLTVQDLEKVLARLDGSTDLRRQVQKTQTMRTELAAALRHTTPAPFIPRWRDLLAAARGLQSQSEQHRADARTANHLLEQEKAERKRLATQLAAAENVVRAQKNVIAEIQNAAEQASRSHLPYGRQWTSVPEQIKALGDQLSKERAAVDSARAQRSETREELERKLREQGDAAARAVQKRKQAEDDLHELRIKISQICAQYTGGSPDGNAYAQLNQIQAWGQELRKLRTGLTDLLGIGSNE